MRLLEFLTPAPDACHRVAHDRMVRPTCGDAGPCRRRPPSCDTPGACPLKGRIRFATPGSVTSPRDRERPSYDGSPNQMIGTETISRVIGKDVYDSSGEKIGSASEVYLDDQSGQPEWVTVRTGLFGTKESFVPIRNADLTDDGVRVPVSKTQVKDAPKIDADGHLSPQEEQELYRYYDIGVAGGTTDTGRTDSTVGRVDRAETTSGMAGTGYADAPGTVGLFNAAATT